MKKQHSLQHSGKYYTNIQIVTDCEVTIENYFSEVGNIPRGFQTQGIFPALGNNVQ